MGRPGIDNFPTEEQLSLKYLKEKTIWYVPGTGRRPAHGRVYSELEGVRAR